MLRLPLHKSAVLSPLSRAVATTVTTLLLLPGTGTRIPTSPALAQQTTIKPQNPCKYSGIPLLGGTFPFARLHDQVFYADRIFWGALDFENLSPKPVISVTTLAEYFGASNERLLSVVYYAEPESHVNADQSVPPSDNPVGLESPIGPHDSHLVTGISLMTTSTCPSYAEVKLVSVEYADHSSAHWEALEWDSTAVLNDSPQYFPIPCGQLAPGFSNHIDLHLDAKGHMEDFSSDAVLDPESKKCLIGEFRQWSFLPALHSGRPVESTVPTLLRVHPPGTDWHSVSGSQVTHPLVIVDIFPEPDVQGKWRVWYGNGPASRWAVSIPD
jgi:hypothetical protein